MKKLRYIIMALFIGLSCFTLTACGETLEKYNVEVDVWYQRYGHASGSGTFDENSDVTINAEPINGSTFVAWMKDNIIVSYDAKYTFKMSQKTSGSYTAIFTSPQLELAILKSVDFVDEYQTVLEITEVQFEIGLSSNSFNNPKTAMKQVVDNSKKEYTEFENIVAVDFRNPVCLTLNLYYTYNETIDGQTSSTKITHGPLYYEVPITAENLISNEIIVASPESLEGSATIKLVFEVLKPKATTPEEGGEQTPGDNNQDTQTNPETK